MSKLNLRFLEDKYSSSENPFIKMLNDFGEQIVNYAPDYFYFTLVEGVPVDGDLVSFHLHTMYMDYTFNLLDIETFDNSIKISLNCGLTAKTSIYVLLREDEDSVKRIVSEWLSSENVNRFLRSLVDKINLKYKAGAI